MQVSEEKRRKLFERLRGQLDEETATLLLEVTVPANIELATRGDFQELRAEMLLGFMQLEDRLTARIAGVEERIAGVEGRFGGLEQRIAGLEERIAAVEERIAGLEERIAAVEERIAGLEERIAGLEERLTERIAAVEQRIGGIETSVAGLATSLMKQVYTVVIPVLVGAVAVIVGVATWIGMTVG